MIPCGISADPLEIEMMGLVRNKWSLPLLNRLREGALRFSELHRRTGPISKSQLAHSLRKLERYGLIARRVLPSMPPQVEYEMTEIGRGYLLAAGGICRWTARHRGDVRAAMAEFDGRDTEPFRDEVFG